MFIRVYRQEKPWTIGTKGTIKTQHPKCRLYWRLIEFIDWRMCGDSVSHVGIFGPPIANFCHSTFSLTSSTPPPLPKVNIQYIQSTQEYRQCGLWGRGGVELCCRPYSAGEKHSVSDQIQNLPNCYTTTPKKHQERRHLRHRRTPCPKFEAWNWIRRVFWMMLQYNANLSLSSSESPTALTN